jgi:hypothetical protein
MSFGGMMRLGVTRFRGWLLLLAFALSLAGQAVAGAAMAAPVAQPAGAHVSALGSCPDCIGGGMDSAMPQCALVFCGTMLAITATGPIIDRFGSVVFFVSPTDPGIGLSPDPDPHPPRISLLV